MNNPTAKHHRRSIRLKDYDYAQNGAYFVTLCTLKRECLLGVIENDAMVLNEFGAIVQACWEDLPNHYPHVELDAFVVMPNHVHAIIVLVDDVGADVGAGLRPAPTSAPTSAPTPRHPLSEIVRALKSFSARRINESRHTPGVSVWQRNYYERVIRNERELQAERDYINNNPLQWALDSDNPNSQRR